MAKMTEYTADVSQGREELLDGKTVARVRTIEVKDQRGETVRQLKAADNDEDVRAKLRAAGYTVKDWPGGTAPATLTRGRGRMPAGRLWALVIMALLMAAGVINIIKDRADPADFSRDDAVAACKQRVPEELPSEYNRFAFAVPDVTGEGLRWNVVGTVRAEASATSATYRYGCQVEFTSKTNYRADVQVSRG